MSTTVSTILNRALSLSLRNRQNAIATSGTELTSVIQRALVEMFVDAATFYPEYFGVRDVVSYNSSVSGWPRPTRALAIYRVELPDGSEIVTVSDREREAERFKPAMIERGRVFILTGSAGGSFSSNIVMIYARNPVTLVDGDLDQVVDSALPDDFVWYLVYSVAVYLAQKDQRSDEIGLLQQQADAWRTAWQKYLQEATQNTRFIHAPRGADAPGTLMTTKGAG